MANLKPCPFCGGTDAYIARNCYGQFYVICPGCGVTVWGRDDEDIRTEKKAEKAWNRRTKVEVNFYDKEETYPNCTVQVLTNTVTGDVSVGWWKNGGAEE